MSDYFNKLKDKDVRDRYIKKVELCEGIDPYTINIKKEGNRDASMLPEIDLDIISEYLLEERSWYTGDQFNAKKSMEAVKIFQSGWILDVVLKELVNPNKILVIGQVIILYLYKLMIIVLNHFIYRFSIRSG